MASLDVTLAESLTGFSRVVLKHLDGRGIHINYAQGRVLKPDQVLKVSGEGMPYKKSDARGDLYLVAKVQFPESGWLKDGDDMRRLRELLPRPPKAINANTVDEVDVEEAKDLDDVRLLRFLSFPSFNFTMANQKQFGEKTNVNGGSAWVDDDEEGDDGSGPQCAQQ